MDHSRMTVAIMLILFCHTAFFKLIFLLHCIGLVQLSSYGGTSSFSRCNHANITKEYTHLLQVLYCMTLYYMDAGLCGERCILGRYWFSESITGRIAVLCWSGNGKRKDINYYWFKSRQSSNHIENFPQNSAGSIQTDQPELDFLI